MAEVEAATKQLLDTRGGSFVIIHPTVPPFFLLICVLPSAQIDISDAGKSLEIVLSPAVKKPRSRVSPPTSPSAAPTQVHGMVATNV